MCRARRDALNHPAPVKRRIIGKRALGHVEVANRAEPMAARTKRGQKSCCPWAEWAKGERRRAELRNKEYTDEEMCKW